MNLDGLGEADIKLDWYSVGFAAGKSGVEVLDCPVPLVSEEGQEWLAGWTDVRT